MKKCICCGLTKDKSSFGKNKRSKDGLNQYCKKCAQAKNKEYKNFKV